MYYSHFSPSPIYTSLAATLCGRSSGTVVDLGRHRVAVVQSAQYQHGEVIGVAVVFGSTSHIIMESAGDVTSDAIEAVNVNLVDVVCTLSYYSCTPR